MCVCVFVCLCVCVSDAHGAHGPHLLRRPRRLLFCRRFALRSDRVSGSPSPNELLQLVATTDAHVVCSVCQLHPLVPRSYIHLQVTGETAWDKPLSATSRRKASVQNRSA